eukprot:CAMPEP_0118872274 /NCGR_PEP_ID=MMETSP1163-20130328/14525_1 /TAXON_ID=124430 /ORGANISM="Phaeomonas parva, Strain CCMP2877" /LENGTH=90 /DNA_ID=CAMNT_0006807443 /DNA_START=175 /DNA_END=447 /DNA_ORIENTATION=-
MTPRAPPSAARHRLPGTGRCGAARGTGRRSLMARRCKLLKTHKKTQRSYRGGAGAASAARHGRPRTTQRSNPVIGGTSSSAPWLPSRRVP